MAIDNKPKRLSMLSFGDGANTGLVIDPDSAITQLDRTSLLGGYGGYTQASLGITSETDTALALDTTQVISVGVASETDSVPKLIPYNRLWNRPGAQIGPRSALNNGSNYDGFPTLVKKWDGNFLCCYRGGVNSHEVTDGGYLLTQEYNGSTWGTAQTLVAAEANKDLRDPGFVRLNKSGYLGLVYNAVPDTGHSTSNEIRWKLSTNDGDTWGSDVVIPDGATTFAICSCNPVQLSNGRILVAIRERNTTYDSTEVYYSDNDGSNWTHLATVGDGDTDGKHYAEPSLTILQDGTLLCLMRDQSASPEQINYSISSDGGATWAAPSFAFNSEAAPRATTFGDKVFVAGRAATNRDVRLIGTVYSSLSWKVWDLNEGTYFCNYGDFFSDGTNLYYVWSQEATAGLSSADTDSDLYMRQISSTANSPYLSASFTGSNGSDLTLHSEGTAHPDNASFPGGFLGWSISETGTANLEYLNNTVTNDTTVAGDNAAFVGQAFSSDGYITGRAAASGDFVIIAFRCDAVPLGSYNGWILQLRGDTVANPGYIRLYRIDSGSAVQIDEANASLVSGTLYPFKIALEGTSISCIVNGVTVSTTSATYQSNTFVGAQLDNIDNGDNAQVDYLVFRPLGIDFVDVGVASETDTALTITSAKTVAVGLASETDTAIALATSQVVTVGLASETDTALGVSIPTIVAVGVASETDSVTSVTPVLSVPETGMIVRYSHIPIRDVFRTTYIPRVLRYPVVVPTAQNISVGIATETDIATALSTATAVGLVSETDTATAVTPLRQVAVGIGSETDTATSITLQRTLSIGLASETDSATAIVLTKTVQVGLASETDTATAVTWSSAIQVGIASETDSAISVSPNAAIQVGLASETDTAIAVAWSKLVSLGIASETDTATTTTPLRSYAIGISTETDTATAVTASRSTAVGIATETDTGISLTPTRIVSVGIASETDSATAVDFTKTVQVGIASETDTARPVSATGAVVVVLASETDTALPVGSLKVAAVGIATETDSALSATAVRSIAVGVASETDTAFAVTSVAYISVGLASETDTGLSATAVRLSAVGVASETDTATAVSTKKVQTVGLASETDTALGVIIPSSGLVKIASETDTAISVTSVRTYSVGLASETDSATAIGMSKVVSVGIASETDTAIAVVGQQNTLVGLSTETTTALSATPVRTVSIGIATETDTATKLSQVVQVGVGSETDIAKNLLVTILAPVGVASEADLAISVTAKGYVDVGVATETDTAVSLVFITADSLKGIAKVTTSISATADVTLTVSGVAKVTTAVASMVGI